MKIAADNIKEFGTTEAIICPRCGKSVYMQLLKATNGVGVLNVPLLTFNIDLFAICPECSSMFAVNNDIAKKIGSSNKTNKYSMVNEKNITFLKDLE